MIYLCNIYIFVATCGSGREGKPRRVPWMEGEGPIGWHMTQRQEGRSFPQVLLLAEAI